MKVTFDGSKCAKSGKCHAGLPKVFYADENDNMVIDSSNATEQEIRDCVAHCPSGALQCVDD